MLERSLTTPMTTGEMHVAERVDDEDVQGEPGGADRGWVTLARIGVGRAGVEEQAEARSGRARSRSYGNGADSISEHEREADEHRGAGDEEVGAGEAGAEPVAGDAAEQGRRQTGDAR